MVVDNAIVVLENIFRHLEMGKKPRAAAFDGTKEVWGAVLASTLTTIAVFIPILLIQEEAGQLFRDIALAICAAVGLSLIVSISVIPAAAARVLRVGGSWSGHEAWEESMMHKHPVLGWVLFPIGIMAAIDRFARSWPGGLARFIRFSSGSTTVRVGVVAVLTIVSVAGTWLLLPPSDYLPQGNRNLVFGLLIPPPGYNLDQQLLLAERVEATVRPYWEAGDLKPTDPAAYARARDGLAEVPLVDFMGRPEGEPVQPPPLENYFFVGVENILFQGGVATEADRVADVVPLLQYAARSDVAPGVFAFVRQIPLFRLGGSSGSAVKLEFVGSDLNQISAAASAAQDRLRQKGYNDVQANPGNFNLLTPELHIVPDLDRLSDLGMTTVDLGLAVQAAGDGAIIGEYREGGEAIDLKVITADAANRESTFGLGYLPIATPTGHLVPLDSLAAIQRAARPQEIARVGRQRAVTLELTAKDKPLQSVIDDVDQVLVSMRTEGLLPPGVATRFSGSASKLQSVQRALFGDGTVLGTLASSMVLALIVVYLLMCVLFQSFRFPLVIMFSVPLATLGGFMALYIVFAWSHANRYIPEQKLDILTMLGFVILIGVVVNNAILIVHQTLNFMRGEDDSSAGGGGPMPARDAIAEAVRTRVRPILMSMLTSVGGMLPLVLAPGAGSELYRGLGSVVVGGLLVSTIFTLLLVPLLLSLVLDLTSRPAESAAAAPAKKPAEAMSPARGLATASRR
jgi:HAE1 family hydrophobic/amphiphilic exporter-1